MRVEIEPGVRLVRFKSFGNAGHGFGRDRPEDALALLRSFIAETTGDRP